MKHQMSSTDIPWGHSCWGTITPCSFLEITLTLIICFIEITNAWSSEGFLYQTPPHKT